MSTVLFREEAVPESKHIKRAEMGAMFRSLVRSNCARGHTLETLSAMAEALQEGLSNYAANEHLPHGQSADTLMRAVAHLLNDPLNEPYITDKLELGMKQASGEFKVIANQAAIEEPEPPKALHPGFRIVLEDGQMVPA